MTTCTHDNAHWRGEHDEGLWCPDCETWLAWECEDCDDGLVYEDDYEGDYINYIHDLVACPTCGGRGLIEDDNFDYADWQRQMMDEGII